MAATISFVVRLTAKFCCDNNQRGVQYPPLFKVGDERGECLIKDRRHVGHFVGQRFVVIPAVMFHLDEADAGLHEAAGEQASLTEGVITVGCPLFF